VVEVEKELMVETFDVLQRRDNLLEVLVLSSSVDGVVNLWRKERKRKEGHGELRARLLLPPSPRDPLDANSSTRS